MTVRTSLRRSAEAEPRLGNRYGAAICEKAVIGKIKVN